MGSAPPEDAGAGVEHDSSPVPQTDSASDADHPVDAPDASDTPLVVDASDAGTTSFDIISSDRCATQSGRLTRCALPPIIVRDARGEATKPRRSSIAVRQTGNCSSQYPLGLRVVADALPAVHFHFEDHAVDVRRTDGAASPSLSFFDDSPWTKTAIYDAGCRIVVDVTMNVADE
jgi:hypothetical protein